MDPTSVYKIGWLWQLLVMSHNTWLSQTSSSPTNIQFVLTCGVHASLSVRCHWSVKGTYQKHYKTLCDELSINAGITWGIRLYTILQSPCQLEYTLSFIFMESFLWFNTWVGLDSTSQQRLNPTEQQVHCQIMLRHMSHQVLYKPVESMPAWVHAVI